jgi:hypothetical protein
LRRPVRNNLSNAEERVSRGVSWGQGQSLDQGCRGRRETRGQGKPVAIDKSTNAVSTSAWILPGSSSRAGSKKLRACVNLFEGLPLVETGPS